MRSPVQMAVRSVTAEDLPAVARVHMLAFPKSALTLLGVEVVRRYYHWQLTGPHDVVALCITEGGKISAFCFGGIFRGALRGFVQKNRRYLLWRVSSHPHVLGNPLVRGRIKLAIQSLRRRASPLGSASKAAIPRPPTFGILSIAVNPTSSGTGQARQLMDCMELAALEHRLSGMHLTVSPDNHQAIGFYEHLGWTRDPDASGTWSGVMRKDIRPLK